MNEMTAFIPGNFRFTFVEDLLQEGVEMVFVIAPVYVLSLAMCFFNQEARGKYGFWSVHMQCFSRASLDTGLVVGICGSMIGVVAMTLQTSAINFETSVGIALLTMLWGGVLVGLGYFLNNPSINIKARISARGLVTGLTIFAGAVLYMMESTGLPPLANFSPFASVAIIPYAIVLLLCCSFFKFAGKPWVVSFTDANLLATIGGLGMGIVLWFKSGGGYEDSRAAIYASALIVMWGTVLYIFAYIAALFLGTQEQGNYQIKTWHLSEAAVFFIFLLYAPVGATEWNRESQDQAAQEANNLSQQQEIDALKAQIATLMKQTEKT